MEITVVFDNYSNSSTKELERNRRGDFLNISSSNTYEVTGTRKVVKYREFLKISRNQRSLLIFMSNFILKNGSEFLKDGETLVVAGGFENSELCLSLNWKNEVNELKDLKCNHTEADTRLILHTIFETNFSKNIVVKSVDTDVLILLLYYCSTWSSLKTKNILIQQEHTSNKKILPVNQIVSNLGDPICKCLPSVHTLTGCDTTNALFKIGKKTAFDVLIYTLSNIINLADEEKMAVATGFVLTLYKNKNKEIVCLNDLRLEMTKSTNRKVSELPPTDNAFKQHVLR